MPTNDIEHEKLELERERFREDALRRREELEIRRAELAARIEEEKRNRIIKFSPAVTGAILVAVLGLLGNVASQVTEGASSFFLERRRLNSSITLEQRKLESEIALEREKFESSLILKALEGKTPQQSAENLRFLVEAGLLESRREKLNALVAQPDRVPTIEPLESRLARMEIQLSAIQCEASGKVFDINLLRCTGVPLR